MNLIWCIYKNYLLRSGNKFCACLNIVLSQLWNYSCFINCRNERNKLFNMFIFQFHERPSIQTNHFRWNQSFKNHTAWSSICIFQGIELYFKLYLRSLYLLYQTSKVVWFYLYKNKDQKRLIQIFSWKWMILLLLFNFHSMHFSALQRTKEHFERHQEVTFNSFIPVLTSPVFNIRTPSPSSTKISRPSTIPTRPWARVLKRLLQ